VSGHIQRTEVIAIRIVHVAEVDANPNRKPSLSFRNSSSAVFQETDGSQMQALLALPLRAVPEAAWRAIPGGAGRRRRFLTSRE
jgi:hypothetical protein